jgi:hypothetical protein
MRDAITARSGSVALTEPNDGAVSKVLALPMWKVEESHLHNDRTLRIRDAEMDVFIRPDGSIE